MNAMGLFHDQWAVSWDMGGVATKVSIIPAPVLTYWGTDAPISDTIRDAGTEKEKKP